MSAGKHDEAISHYSTALSFNSVIPLDVFMKRSKVYMAMGLWDDAIQDAKKVSVTFSLLKPSVAHKDR